MWTVSQEKDEVWDAGEGSTGTGRVEQQLPGCGQHRAVQREGLLWENDAAAKG